MIWISALLVFGTFAVIGLNLGSEDGELHLGFQQLIHARTPWLLLGLVWGGAALGVASLFRRRPLWKLPIVATEIALAGLLSWYVLAVSILPPHELVLAVGDPFPSYALPDQEGNLRRYDASAPGDAALYIFYRGDW